LCAAHLADNEPGADGERAALINAASIAAFEGQIGQVAYTAAKAGIAGTTLTMAHNLGSLGIRIKPLTSPKTPPSDTASDVPTNMPASLQR
jgi:NAD(P)-dependent dehydrogenase (short-subunit alcohol dehydrogenase family)